jgi:uncharacterized protein YjbI with pentapeptide repeats
MAGVSNLRPPPPTATRMATFSAAEILRRYGAGERDFRALNMKGLRLRGENLSGADFSGADLRSTDFSDALLQGTNFSKALGGRQRHWSVVMLVLTLLLCGAAGAILGFTSGFLALLVVGVNGPIYKSIGLVPTIAAGATFVLGFLFLAWEGPTVRGFLAVAVAVVLIACIAIASDTDVVFVVGSISFAYAGALACAAAVGVAGAVALAAAAPAAIGVAVAVAVAVAIIGAGTVGMDGTGASILIFAFFTICFWRSRQEAPGYASSRLQGLALEAVGGTCFRGADLGGAFFCGTRLRGSNFASSQRRPTRLDQVRWKGASGLAWARVGGTILADPSIRRLLVEGTGHGQEYSNLNLRGAYLAGADLRDAGFRNSILSGAILIGAHLEGANLAGAQCLGTDFSEAHLTGACLGAWNIDNSTNLHGADCAYVYLLESHDAQGHRREELHRERLPHDLEKCFEPGDLEAYFKQVLEEVKLLIRNGVDPKAFHHAFHAVMQQHPQITPKSLTGIKLIGNDVMATLQVPAGSNKSAIEHTFDAKYLAMELENAHLKGLLAGERRRADDHRDHVQQALQAVARLAPATGPPSITIENRPSIHIVNENTSNTTHTSTDMTHNEIKAGDGSLINTGKFQPSGGIVNLGALSERARITIEAVPDSRLDVNQPSLRELLSQLKTSIDADTSLNDTTRADALAEVNDLAQAAQDPAKNASLARRSINALKGLNEGIGESFKLATALKSLLPLIAGFF